MEVSKYLRLALMFGNNDAKTFNKNLEKMISLVLYDNNCVSMSSSEIIEGLRRNYSLMFSDVEVYAAIKGQRKKNIISLETIWN